MRNPLLFLVELFKQSAWLIVWVAYLIAINLFSLNYWQEPLAQVIFFTFMFSVTLIIGIFSLFGFERIMGLGHILWIPMILYLVMQFPQLVNPFKTYVAILIASNLVSLVFDTRDVWLYFKQKH